MKLNNEKKDDIMVQAGVLAIAGILSRIIGLLYKSPLTGVIGSEGMGYYTQAYNYYTIVLLISSYSIPSAISKVIAQKLAVREYKNAHRTFIGALIYVLVVGTIGSLVLFFGAEYLVGEDAAPVLRLFAPTIMLYGILGVLRGYFQAHRSMMQTSCSQIIEQFINAIVSVGAAVVMINFTMGTLARPDDASSQTKRAISGAMGSALGTGMGVVSGLLFMLLAYYINKKMIISKVQRDKKHQVESYRDIFVRITLVVTPFILSTAIYNLSPSVNQTIFLNEKCYPFWSGRELKELVSQFGLLSGQALTISNIPIAFASAMAAAMIPSVATLIASQNVEDAKAKIGLSVKTIMLISIPCAAGIMAISKSAICLLFPVVASEWDMSGRLLLLLGPSIIFYALSTLNSSILQGIGKVVAPIINAAKALVIQTVVLVAVLLFTDMGVYAIVIANTVYSGIMCILNQNAVRNAIGYRQEYRTTFIVPGIASVIMAAVVWFCNKGLYIFIHSLVVMIKDPVDPSAASIELLSTRIAVIPAILVGVIVYFACLIKFKGLSEEEMLSIPKGTVILRLARKLKLMD